MSTPSVRADGASYRGGMAIELNRPALDQARRMVRDGDVVRDERDDWSEAAPTADQENDFIAEHGWTEFAHWHLGIDKSKDRETKAAYGDFERVRRSGVISGESRAGQYDHTGIRDELRTLLELIDRG